MPIVQISDGVRIDDAFAARLVDRMLHALRDGHSGFNRELATVRDRRSSIGNPKGQKRIFDRMCEIGRRSLLAAGVKTGTRCRFQFAFEMWSVTSADHFDPHRGPPAWLVGMRAQFTGRGPNQDLDFVSAELVALSRHVLERMVQRGACKTEDDFIDVMRRAWMVLGMAVYGMTHLSAALPRDGESAWVLPVELANGETIYLVIKRNTKKGPIAMVTTAFTEDMGIDASAVAPLRGLVKELEEHQSPEKLAKDPRLLPALQATAKATRRGRRQA